MGELVGAVGVVAFFMALGAFVGMYAGYSLMCEDLFGDKAVIVDGVCYMQDDDGELTPAKKLVMVVGGE